MRRSMYTWRITSESPSSSTMDGAVSRSSATSAGSRRALGKGTSEYSQVSAIRPTRSWNFTSWYCFWTNSRLTSLLRRSLMILNT